MWFQITGDQAGLRLVSDEYDRFVRRHAVPDDVRRDMYVALEEIVSNVVRHGSADGAVGLNIGLTIHRGVLRIDVSDDGRPFDPFVLPPADVDQPLLDRPVGGLGVLLARELTDRYRYRRRGDWNQVRISRHLLKR